VKRIVLPLRTWLVLSHLFVLLLPVVALLATRALAYDLRDQTRRTLEYQGVLIAMLAADAVEDARRDLPKAVLADAKTPLTSVLVRTKRATLAGIRLVNANGVVVASSGEGLGQDLSTDTEVQQALRTHAVGVAVRPRPGAPSPLQIVSRSRPSAGPPSSSVQRYQSQSRHANVRLFVTVPIVLDGELLGAVVMSRTPREEIQAIFQMAPRLWWGALAALFATIALALFYGYLFSRSLRHMAKLSSAIAQHPGRAGVLLDGPRRSHVAEVAGVAEALIATADRLDTRLAYIGEFAANVSHEFQTPLSTLRGTIELMQDDDDMPAAQRSRFLNNAGDELVRLERLVTGLLALARAEQVLAREPVDLDAVLHTLAERHAPTSIQGTAGHIAGDAHQLQTVFGNLLANAHRYGGDTVWMRITRTAHTVQVTVSDDGLGISPVNQMHIFDRFFTTGRARGGTGVGLALVRAIVVAHEGSVSCESRPGYTGFIVTLPRNLG
jgi:signal transduction histidine kinase